MIKFLFTDLDECVDGTHKCDLDTTQCDNTVGSYTCSCLDGYLPEDDFRCKGDTHYSIYMFICLTRKMVTLFFLQFK